MTKISKIKNELIKKYGVPEEDVEKFYNSIKDDCTQPVELIIPTEDIVKVYKITEAKEIVKCKNCIYLHCNGYWVVSKPGLANGGRGGSLYQTLLYVCDSYDAKLNETDDDVKTFIDIVFELMFNPLDVFYDWSYAITICTELMTRKAEVYRRLLNEEEHVDSPEDELKNAEFMEMVDVIEKERRGEDVK